MIGFDLDYYRPETVGEAAEAFRAADGGERQVLFFGGGTEIVTMARDRRIRPGAVIDIKQIPETQGLEKRQGEIRVGSSVTLSRITDSGVFPLLAQAAGGVADRTVRNSITVGGNIAGMLPYRESVLPFMLFDTVAELATDGHITELPFSDIFNKRLRLFPGTFLVALRVPDRAASTPYFYSRRVKDSRIDYPLVTLCAVSMDEGPDGDMDGGMRFAVSGAHGYPLRSEEAEQALQEGEPRDAAARAVDAMDVSIRGDLRASAEYRAHLLRLSLEEARRTFDGGGAEGTSTGVSG